MQGTVLSLRDAIMIKAEVPVLRELILQCVHFFFFIGRRRGVAGQQT